MKGYVTSPASLVGKIKVADYDASFPKGDYQIDFDTPGLKVWDSSTSKYEDIPDLKPENVKMEGGLCTATLNDGSKLTIAYDESDIPTGKATLDITGIGGMKIQVGTRSGQEIQVVIPKMDTVSMGIEGIDMRTEEGARKSLKKIAGAIEYVSNSRSRLGAYQNRLESTIASLAETTENLEGSYSTVKDVDMAEEMVDYTKLQVLVQAGTSMLAQANEQPQQALQLLQ